MKINKVKNCEDVARNKDGSYNKSKLNKSERESLLDAIDLVLELSDLTDEKSIQSNYIHCTTEDDDLGYYLFYCGDNFPRRGES